MEPEAAVAVFVEVLQMQAVRTLVAVEDIPIGSIAVAVEELAVALAAGVGQTDPQVVVVVLGKVFLVAVVDILLDSTVVVVAEMLRMQAGSIVAVAEVVALPVAAGAVLVQAVVVAFAEEPAVVVVFAAAEGLAVRCVPTTVPEVTLQLA